MWSPGQSLQLTGTAQQLNAVGVGLVKALRIYQWPTNTHPIYSGDSTLDPTTSPTPTGVTGWAPAPSPGNSIAPYIDVVEPQAMNGINTQQVYVNGTQGEIITWAYVIQ